MVKKPTQELKKDKGYKTRGLTAAKWKKPAHPAEDASSRPAVHNSGTKEKSRFRTGKESPVPDTESKKII